jgi:ADP-heptose:LPS heptosyltransferase
MKIVKTNTEISLEFVSDSRAVVRISLKPNTKYIMSDGVLQHTTQIYGSNCLTVETDFKDLPNKFNNQDLTNKTLFLIREGGAGDLLFLTPAMKYLKEKYSGVKIFQGCMPVYSSLFNNHKYIDAVFPHIFPYEDFIKADYFCTFEGIIEGSKEAEVTNAYDLFINRLGIPLSEIPVKIPNFVVSDKVKDYWKMVLNGQFTDKNIGFQLRASSPIRTLPPQLNAEIIKKLTDKGFKVFLLESMDRKNDTARFINHFQLQNVVDCSPYSDNFERLAGIISLMDLFVGPDSSGNHLAAGLNIPLVGLFGPFRSALRLKYYKNAVGIDAMAQRCNDGNGCYQHSYDLCDFSKELGIQWAPCWGILSADVVVEQVEKLFIKSKLREFNKEVTHVGN